MGQTNGHANLPSGEELQLWTEASFFGKEQLPTVGFESRTREGEQRRRGASR